MTLDKASLGRLLPAHAEELGRLLDMGYTAELESSSHTEDPVDANAFTGHYFGGEMTTTMSETITVADPSGRPVRRFARGVTVKGYGSPGELEGVAWNLVYDADAPAPRPADSPPADEPRTPAALVVLGVVALAVLGVALWWLLR